MAATAAGNYRRTPLERADQRVSWMRPDQAFFAAGACHILAWVCRELHPERPIGITGLRLAAEQQVFHVYATWNGWAFDHSGWNPEPQLFKVNQDFEGRPLERVTIASDLAAFCAEHNSRMPNQYWRDPLPRARDYAVGYPPPWESGRRQT
ncbi:hypothetical protein [Phytohabitans kaempferiae]|uniref:Uncharacterized protein n=1 Tax=Phytohabitans kaempferiae TaxID=1620943 RepID=A0ABV6MCD7_9ACTN